MGHGILHWGHAGMPGWRRRVANDHTPKRDRRYKKAQKGHVGTLGDIREKC